MRLEQFRRTRLHGAYPSSDLVLLAEIALLGGFVELPEPLFFHRIHPGSTMRAFPDPRQRMKFFNPDGRSVYPSWRLLGEYLRAINHMPLTVGDRLRSAGALPRWAAVRRRTLAYEVATSLPGPTAAFAERARTTSHARRLPLAR
jgi:hypothetical protein